MYKNLYITLFIMPLFAFSQSNSVHDSIPTLRKTNNYKALIIPSLFICYGIVSLESDYLKTLNYDTKEELAEHIDKRFTIDDFSQYAPAVAVYGLNTAGIQGKNNLKDRSIILADRKSVV